MKFIHNWTLLLFFIALLGFCLRLYKITTVPASLHGDEVGVGYNAYTLTKYGVDEYGKTWPLSFRADVTPLIFYATVPFVALLGPTELAIKLPSVFVGTVTIFLFYFFVRELLSAFRFLEKENIIKIALLGALLLSISPWHIQISRITHDASYGICVQLLALITFFKSTKKNSWILLLTSFSFFGLSFYAYHGPRLTTPLIMLTMVFMLRDHISWKKIVVSSLLFSLILLPFISNTIQKPLAETRFGGINIFIRENPNESILLTIPGKLISSFLRQLNPNYIFFDSTSVRYFNVWRQGLLYIGSIFFIFLGFKKLFVNRKLFLMFMILIFISVLPGALTLGPPNAGRIALLFPFLEIITAIGLVSYIKYSQNIKTTLLVIAILWSLQLIFFSYQYFVDSPKRFATQWQYGAKEIAQLALQREKNVDRIIISSSFKQEYIYVLFYGRKNPLEIMKSVTTQKHSFIGYSAFDRYEFRPIIWDTDQFLSNTFIVATPDEVPESLFTSKFTDPKGAIIFGTLNTPKKI